MKERVLPYSLIGEVNSATLTEKINKVLNEVYAGWFSTGHGYHFEMTHRNELIQIQHSNWNIFANAEDFWIAFQQDDKSTQKILAKMLGLEQFAVSKLTAFTSKIYEDFIQSNLTALFNLANTMYIRGNAITSIDTYQGSGAIRGIIRNQETSLPIALGGGLVRAICNIDVEESKAFNRHQLTAREKAISPLKTGVYVNAGHIEITVEELAGLEAGDVLVLNNKLGSPFSVYSKNKNFLAHAQLGKCINQKAIQLIE